MQHAADQQHCGTHTNPHTMLAKIINSRAQALAAELSSSKTLPPPARPAPREKPLVRARTVIETLDDRSPHSLPCYRPWEPAAAVGTSCNQLRRQMRLRHQTWEQLQSGSVLAQPSHCSDVSPDHTSRPVTASPHTPAREPPPAKRIAMPTGIFGAVALQDALRRRGQGMAGLDGVHTPLKRRHKREPMIPPSCPVPQPERQKEKRSWDEPQVGYLNIGTELQQLEGRPMRCRLPPDGPIPTQPPSHKACKWYQCPDPATKAFSSIQCSGEEMQKQSRLKDASFGSIPTFRKRPTQAEWHLRELEARYLTQAQMVKSAVDKGMVKEHSKNSTRGTRMSTVLINREARYGRRALNNELSHQERKASIGGRDTRFHASIFNGW